MLGSPPGSLVPSDFKAVLVSTFWALLSIAGAAAATAGLDYLTEAVTQWEMQGYISSTVFTICAALIHAASKALREFTRDTRKP